MVEIIGNSTYPKLQCKILSCRFNNFFSSEKMKITPTQRKKIKKDTLAIINSKFTDTEKDTGEIVPDDFKKIFGSMLNPLIPEDTSDLIMLKEGLTNLSHDIEKTCKGEGDKLDSECKEFIIQLLDELFFVTNNQGIGNNLWKHFPNLWDKVQLVNKIFVPRKNQKPSKTVIHNTLIFYENFYEFTIKHLIEFAFVIAQNSQDIPSKKFVENYNKKAKNGQNILSRDLLEYCKTKHFLKQGQCSFFRDAWIRNSVAHANYRYDEKTHIIILGKKEMTIFDLRDSLMRLYSFNIFLLFRYFEKNHFFDNLFELFEKTNIPE